MSNTDNMLRYTVSDKYVLRKISGEYMLVSIGSGVADFCGVVTLNQTAALLWEQMQEGAAVDEMVSKLIDTYTVSEEQARSDVEKTLAMLLDRGMVTNA